MVDKRNIVVVLIIFLFLMGAYLSTKDKPIFDKPTFSILLEKYYNTNHEVSLIVSDQNDNVIFNQTQLMPSTEVSKLYEGVTTKKGTYLVKVTVDKNITAEEKVDFNEEKMLVIYITPENIDFGYVMP